MNCPEPSPPHIRRTGPQSLDAVRCYKAMADRDAAWDGIFFTGVTSTGIYCRPVCRVKLPRATNCLFFETPAQAESHGFRPCLRCRPELAPARRFWSTTDAGTVLAEFAAKHLHAAIHQRFPAAKCVVHTHSDAATALARLHRDPEPLQHLRPEVPDAVASVEPPPSEEPAPSSEAVAEEGEVDVDLAVCRAVERTHRRLRMATGRLHRAAEQQAAVGRVDTALARVRAVAGLPDSGAVFVQLNGTVLANQMLALAKVEQLRHQGEAPVVDCEPVLRAVALDLAPLIAERQLDFDLQSEPAQVRAHEWSLRELVRNLLHNAIKHTPAHGALSVRLICDARQGCARSRKAVCLPCGVAPSSVCPASLPRLSGRKGGSASGLRVKAL